MATFDAEEFANFGAPVEASEGLSPVPADFFSNFGTPVEGALEETVDGEEFEIHGSSNSVLRVDWVADFTVRVTFKSAGVAGIGDASRYALFPSAGGVGITVLAATVVSPTQVDLTVTLATSGINYNLAFTAA